MLTLKIKWESPDYPAYSVYTAWKYNVNDMLDGSKSLILFDREDQPTEIGLSNKCKVYVMNSNGATIDTIN